MLCAQEFPVSSVVAPPISPEEKPLPLPPTSPLHGYSHPISQNSMFTAPPGSRFVLAPNSTLSVTIYLARNIHPLGAPKSHPYVRAIQGEFKYMSTTALAEDNPVWNETFKFPILNPVNDLMIFEVWDDKTLGKTLLGFFPVDLSLLPRGVEVDTWESLSGSTTNGELSIGLTATGFGLECLPAGYDKLYENWRATIPPVSKDSPIYTKKHGAPVANPLEAPGPYSGKNVPSGYIVDNGHVKRVPSVMSKALGKAKGMLGIGGAAR